MVNCLPKRMFHQCKRRFHGGAPASHRRGRAFIAAAGGFTGGGGARAGGSPVPAAGNGRGTGAPRAFPGANGPGGAAGGLRGEVNGARGGGDAVLTAGNALGIGRRAVGRSVVSHPPESPENLNQMKDVETTAPLSPAQREELLGVLKARFEQNASRHQGVEWAEVEARLELSPEKLWSLHEMERTGGEPDVVGRDEKTGETLFFDCSTETPKGRVSVCYDRAGLDSRKDHKPETSAMDMAAAMGIELLTEEQYQELQKLGNFDLKTSSWVKAPADMRKLGGAPYCERRYGRIFVGHNGAQSYYGARGFRGALRV